MGSARSLSKSPKVCKDKKKFCNLVQPDCKLAKTREQCARYCGECSTGMYPLWILGLKYEVSLPLCKYYTLKMFVILTRDVQFHHKFRR